MTDIAVADTSTEPAGGSRPVLLGQTVVVIGGTAGIGLETARQARAEGAQVVLTGRNSDRLEQAGRLVQARSTASFDAHDPDALERFFAALPGPIDHVMVTAGSPQYRPILEMDTDEARSAISDRLLLAIGTARNARANMRPGGTVVLMGATGGVRPGLGLLPTIMAAMRALTASLALELAPARVNLIEAGFVDTPLSASLLGDGLAARRAELRATLPIRRVIGPADVAALALQLMTNTALTGASFDIDGGQQLVG